MTLRDRIGIDVGRRLRLEDAIEWAAEHDVRWIDIQLDAGANALSSLDETRAASVRRACAQHKVGTPLRRSTSRKWHHSSATPLIVISRPMSRLRQGSAPSGSSCMPASISLPTRRNGWPPVSID